VFRRLLLAPALTMMTACGGGEEAAEDALVERGEIVFERVCMACHALDAENRVGPSLKGVIGRPVASVPGFVYSDAMARDRKSVWTEARIKSYLMGPTNMYPEGRMVIEPLSAKDADAVIALLRNKG